VIKLTVVIIENITVINFIPILSNILLSRLRPYVDEMIGNQQCGVDVTAQLLIRCVCICQILEKKWEYNEAVHQLFIDFKKAIDSVRREV
jgi:hypothetical protein